MAAWPHVQSFKSSKVAGISSRQAEWWGAVPHHGSDPTRPPPVRCSPEVVTVQFEIRIIDDLGRIWLVKECARSPRQCNGTVSLRILNVSKPIGTCTVVVITDPVKLTASWLTPVAKA